MFDTCEANHHFAPPPYTPLAGSQSLSSLQLPLGTALFKAQGDIECCFTSFGNHSWGSSSVFRQMRENIHRVGYRVAWDTSVGDVVEFHSLLVPMGWNWASSRCWNTFCWAG